MLGEIRRHKTSHSIITAVITVYSKPAAKLVYFVPDTHNLIDYRILPLKYQLPKFAN